MKRKSILISLFMAVVFSFWIVTSGAVARADGVESEADSLEPVLNREEGAVLSFAPVNVLAPDATLEASVLGTYRGGIFSRNSPGDRPVYDPSTRRVFNASGDRQAVDIIDIHDPRHPIKIGEIDISAFGNEPQAVSVKRGLVAVTVVFQGVPEIPGFLLFFNVDGDPVANPIALTDPNKIEFSRNGRQVIVTSTGQPSFLDTSFDPEASVTVVDLGRVPWGACRFKLGRCWIEPTVEVINFQDLNDDVDALRDAGIRIYTPGATVAEDLEIEGVALSRNSLEAWVSFERNNAIGRIDLRRRQLIDIFSAGTQDHSLEGNGCDCSDSDGPRVTVRPVKSFSQPDGIALHRFRGRDFLVLANEGDPRNFEETRLRDVTLDPATFPDASVLQSNDEIGRLKITNVEGDTDSDGDVDEIWMLGSRSFSIRTSDGELVFDSGDQFVQITATHLPEFHNASEDENEGDARSDDRGPEPEHLALGRVGKRTYAFFPVERISGIFIYDITNPYDVKFQQYINNRNFAVEPKEVCGEKGMPQMPTCERAGDLEPEGVTFVPGILSPTFRPMLIVNHELSDTVTMYDLGRL